MFHWELESKFFLETFPVYDAAITYFILYNDQCNDWVTSDLGMP